PEAAEGHTIGLLLRDEERKKVCAFVPTCGDLDPLLRARLAQADILLFDGTFWADRELLDLGISSRTAREMDHQPIGGPGGSLARLAENQNVSRRPIWPVLVDATPVILPKLGAVRVVTGLLYCGQLNALNASARTCSSVPPRRLNDFASERSTRRRPGPCTCE